jgi:hypothetical protein
MRKAALWTGVLVTAATLIAAAQSADKPPVLRVAHPKAIILMGAGPECTPEEIRAIVDWTLACMGVREQRVPVVIVVHQGEIVPHSPAARQTFMIEGRQYCSLPGREMGFPLPGPGWVLQTKMRVFGAAQLDLVSGAPAVVHVSPDMGALVHEIAHVAPHIGGDWGRAALHGTDDNEPEELTIQRCNRIVIDCKVSSLSWR